jgi:hypothetical protein
MVMTMETTLAEGAGHPLALQILRQVRGTG